MDKDRNKIQFEQKNKNKVIDLSYKEIEDTVCEFYNIPKSLLPELPFFRHLIAYLIRQLTYLSLKEISNIIESSTHTTSLHRIAKIKKLKKIYPELQIQILQIRTLIYEKRKKEIEEEKDKNLLSKSKREGTSELDSQ